MAFHENVSISIITRSEGDKCRGISYPPIPKSDISFIEHIKDAVYRCMNFTSKLCNYCEVSGKHYDDDAPLMLYQIPGAKNINYHHCAGNIIYHTDYEKYLKYVNMYFEWQENVIQKHSWCGETIKFQRSNGIIMESTIAPNSVLCFKENKLMFYVEFIKDNLTYYKLVPVLNYTSSRKDVGEIKGLLELNPHLKDKELILSISDHPEWMNEERSEWKNLMEQELTKSGINFKFEIIDN